MLVEKTRTGLRAIGDVPWVSRRPFAITRKSGA